VVDQHFLRYAQFPLPGGTTLEVVEPSSEFTDFHDVTIVCFTVDDLTEGLRELATRQQTPISPVFTDGQDWGWTYLRMPDGGIYQLQGNVADQSNMAPDTARAHPRSSCSPRASRRPGLVSSQRLRRH
jgi:hypothetical protein